MSELFGVFTLRCKSNNSFRALCNHFIFCYILYSKCIIIFFQRKSKQFFFNNNPPLGIKWSAPKGLLYSALSINNTFSKEVPTLLKQQARVGLHNYILFLNLHSWVYSPSRIHTLVILSSPKQAPLMPGTQFNHLRGGK